MVSSSRNPSAGSRIESSATSIFNQYVAAPGDSGRDPTWSPIVGGHLIFERVTYITIPQKKAPAELPGSCYFRSSNLNASVYLDGYSEVNYIIWHQTCGFPHQKWCLSGDAKRYALQEYRFAISALYPKQPFFNGCLVKQPIVYVKIWNHPIERTSKNWFFGVPGTSYQHISEAHI